MLLSTRTLFLRILRRNLESNNGHRQEVPNTITSMNLLCGVLGVIASLNGRLELAFVLMIVAAAFDFCDGLAARLLKAYSEIGKELDSLADDVSFGVLPAVMLFSVSGTDIVVLKYLPLLLAVFSALRLAKFNLDERHHRQLHRTSYPCRRHDLRSAGHFGYCPARLLSRRLVRRPCLHPGTDIGAVLPACLEIRRCSR